MNEKLAKALRRRAREVTAGALERRLVALRSKHGALQAVNALESARGVYRALKRAARIGGCA